MTVVKELLWLSSRDCCIMFFLNPSTAASSFHLALETMSVRVARKVNKIMRVLALRTTVLHNKTCVGDLPRQNFQHVLKVYKQLGRVYCASASEYLFINVSFCMKN